MDTRTDLFSFGAVLYQMATGQFAFRGATLGMIMHAILAQRPVPPVRINPRVPAKLEEIINKALEKDRNLRYQHSSEIGTDLRRLQRDSGSVGRAETVEAIRAIPAIGAADSSAARDTPHSGEFRTETQQTYRELWGMLENVHVRLRTERLGSDEFRSLVRDINSYILKHDLYLEKDDQALANQYLSKLREFTDKAASCDSTEVKESVELTGPIPSHAVRQVLELHKIETEVNQIRDKILLRYRQMLMGTALQTDLPLA